MADIVLINPRFEVSCWVMKHALTVAGKPAGEGPPDPAGGLEVWRADMAGGRSRIYNSG